MIRVTSLGSGSTGNATLVEASSGITTTRLLIDCGFSLRELEMRLARIGLRSTDLDALFVTHEHGDHVGCALALARRHGTPVWTSRGTWHAIDDGDEPPLRLHLVRDGETVAIGDIECKPYTVPHDAARAAATRLRRRRLDLRRADRRRLDHAAHAQRSSGAATRCCSSAITTPRCSQHRTIQPH